MLFLFCFKLVFSREETPRSYRVVRTLWKAAPEKLEKAARVCARNTLKGPFRPKKGGKKVPRERKRAKNARRAKHAQAVEATQQLSGNLFSALLVPVYQAAANYDVQLESQTEGRPPLHFGFGQDVAADLGRFNVPGILLPEPMHMVAHDMRGDTLLLLVLVASTLAYFSKFDFDLKRSAFDDA